MLVVRLPRDVHAGRRVPGSSPRDIDLNSLGGGGGPPVDTEEEQPGEQEATQENRHPAAKQREPFQKEGCFPVPWAAADLGPRLKSSENLSKSRLS